MRRTMFAVLAFAAALLGLLFTASVAGAQAPAATIRHGVDDDWSPPNVTVTHRRDRPMDVRRSDAAAQRPRDERQLEPAATVADRHRPGAGRLHVHGARRLHVPLRRPRPAMSGIVTVEEPGADPLENVLVFSETAGFRHTRSTRASRRSRRSARRTTSTVDATEDSAAFNDRQPRPVRRRRLPLHHRRRPHRRAAGRVRGLHAGRRRLRRHPRRGRHRVHVAWYGQMLGGYFRNHPAGTPTATVHIEDTDEPSTEGLPINWVRIDEWYNYQSPVNPVVNGGGDDYSPRDSGVKVLATMDESTYDEDDGNDHQRRPPDRVVLGLRRRPRLVHGARPHRGLVRHREGNIRSHILGGLQTVDRRRAADCGEPRQATPEPSTTSRSSRSTTTPRARWSSPSPTTAACSTSSASPARSTSTTRPTARSTTAITIPVSSVQENGAMGIALDPNFDTNNHLYVAYTPLPDTNNVRRASRASRSARTTPSPRPPSSSSSSGRRSATQCCHSGGSLAFARTATSTSPPATTRTRSRPTASRRSTSAPGREFWDAQRTSANSNNHNGKVLRIHPLPGATGAPGIGTTYSIPAGNMFAPGTANDAARDLRDGLPQPVPDHHRSAHGLGAGRQLRA